MIGLRKLLQRDTPPDESPETDLDPGGRTAGEMSDEYHDIVMDQLLRGGISPACVELEVRPTGKLKDGRINYIGMLRLVRWERPSALRLLIGLPILESRVRRVVRGSWLTEVSNFGGVWLHPSGQLQDSHAMEDLRLLLLDIERRGPDSLPSGSVWSLPTDLAPLPER